MKKIRQISSFEQAVRRAKVIRRLLILFGMIIYYIFDSGIIAVCSYCYFIILRPYFGLSLLFVICFLLYYLLVFNSFWHESQSRENMFWSFYSVLVCLTLFVLPDSPFYSMDWFLRNFPVIVVCSFLILIIIVIFVFVSYIDHSVYHYSLTASENMKKSYSSVNLLTDTEPDLAVILEEYNRVIEENMVILSSGSVTFWNLKQSILSFVFCMFS